MATNPARITVAQTVNVYLGPVGSTAPTGAESVIDPAFKEVGLTTDDSMSFATEPEFEEVTSHQSGYPTRRIQTTDAATLSVDLQEWSPDNFKAVFGGGTVTEIAGPPISYKFAPPTIGAREEVACIVGITDNTKKYRLVIPRCMQIEGTEMELQKGSEAVLQLRLAVLGGEPVDAWYLLTNDPAFETTP